MSALLEIARFECRYHLRSPVFYATAAGFFLVHLLSAAQAGIHIGLELVDTSQLALNAAFAVIQNEAVLSIFGTLPVLVFVVTAVTRDHERKTAELFFAAPIPEKAHFWGRFLGGTASALLIGVAGLLGALAAPWMPWLDPQTVDAFAPAPYAFALAAIVVPNTLVFGGLAYGVAALTRSTGAAFGIALALLGAVFSTALDPDRLQLMAVLEPSGVSALLAETRYWTTAELASRLPGGWIWINRGVWTGLSLAVLGLCGSWYRFRLEPSRLRLRRRRPPKPGPSPTPRKVSPAPRSTGASSLRQLASMLFMDVRSVLRSVPFYVALALCVQAAVAHVAGDAFETLGTPSFPVTSMMLGFFRFGLALPAVLVILYYAGELVHRDRQVGTAEIVDASPVGDGLFVVSKALALCLAVTSMMLVSALTLVALQLADGYRHLELGLYATGIFGFSAFQYFMLSVLAIFIQLLSPNRWIGMLVAVGLLVLVLSAPFLGFEHGLYRFVVPFAVHTDMNGFGDFVAPVFWYTIYWGAFCSILMVAGHLLYPRGYRDRASDRLAQARALADRRVAALLLLATATMTAAGGWIFYNTNVLNEYTTSRERDARRAEYERRFSRYRDQSAPQPVDVDLAVDIYPEERRVVSHGTARLANLSGTEIDAVALFLDPDVAVEELTLEGARVAESDAAHGFRLFRFAPPLAAGARTRMTWHLTRQARGFPNGGPSPEIVANGTFFELPSIFPHGYDDEQELVDARARRRQGLPPTERLPAPDAVVPRSQMELAALAHAEARITLSTSLDQIAVASGRLLREWQQGDRRYFEYGGETPLWPAVLFTSARYEVVRDDWNGIELEILHDPGHGRSVDTIRATAKRSLDHFTSDFSPYQYGVFRIVEFPRYRTFARAFAASVAVSESLSFLSRFEEGEMDFVTAHELAHQWWGGQVRGARKQGSAQLHETLATYSALMVIEAENGTPAVARQLAALEEGYLSFRGRDPVPERPLMFAEGPNLAYNKGGLVLYALRDILGEETLNRALRSFVERHTFLRGPSEERATPRFPSSRDFVGEIRAVADAEHQELITDLFERITFYDLRITSASSRSRGDAFEVTLEIEARELDATEPGRETEAPLLAPFDVAVFGPPTRDDELGEPLYLEKHWLRNGRQSLSILVPGRPASVGVDPYGRMIERDSSDNLRTL